MSQKLVRAAVGVVALLLLVFLVGGWLSDYRRAAEQQRVAPRPDNRTREQTATPSDAGGEEATAPAAKKDAGDATVVILIDGLNFRPEPDEDASPIRGLDKGERLDLLSTRKGWYEVRDEDGERGWVSSNPSYTKTERR